MNEIRTRRGHVNTTLCDLKNDRLIVPHAVAEHQQKNHEVEVSEESSGTGLESSDEDEELDPSVLEGMQQFKESFKGIDRRYRLINRIGEGM